MLENKALSRGIIRKSACILAAITIRKSQVVYAKLLSYAWHNNQVFPGQERMAEEIGSSKSTVGRAVQELEEQGWLEIQRRGQGKTNVYILKYKVTSKTGKKGG